MIFISQNGSGSGRAKSNIFMSAKRTLTALFFFALLGWWGVGGRALVRARAKKLPYFWGRCPTPKSNVWVLLPRGWKVPLCPLSVNRRGGGREFAPPLRTPGSPARRR